MLSVWLVGLTFRPFGTLMLIHHHGKNFKDFDSVCLCTWDVVSNYITNLCIRFSTYY